MSETPVFPRYFSNGDRAVVAALMARIIPSDDGEPGAAEAGAVDFLDQYLCGPDYVWALPDGSGFEQLTGRRRAAWASRIDIVRSKYRSGITAVQSLSLQIYGVEFTELLSGQQDDVLRALEKGRDGREARQPGEVLGESPRTQAIDLELQMSRQDEELSFFSLLVAHTRQGFYSDPVYGGNRNRVGWDWIGFPGPNSMVEVLNGEYSTLAWFSESRVHPSSEED